MEGNLLYELTAHAARMCLPVPVPTAAPDGWIDRLDHWQTLAGATAGGLLGVAGAWIVAASQRHRERRVAAGMVLPDLQQLVAAAAALERSLPRRHVEGAGLGPALNNMQLDGQRIVSAVKRLAERRPPLFALQSPVIGQLSDIDERLYGHLFQCQIAHRRFEESMDALANDQRPSIPPIYEDWQRCAVQARFATYFIDRFVFSRWPRWAQRWRMKLWPNDLDRGSRRLLRTGELPAAPPQSGEPGAPAPA